MDWMPISFIMIEQKTLSFREGMNCSKEFLIIFKRIH